MSQGAVKDIEPLIIADGMTFGKEYGGGRISLKLQNEHLQDLLNKLKSHPGRKKNGLYYENGAELGPESLGTLPFFFNYLRYGMSDEMDGFLFFIAVTQKTRLDQALDVSKAVISTRKERKDRIKTFSSWGDLLDFDTQYHVLNLSSQANALSALANSEQEPE